MAIQGLEMNQFVLTTQKEEKSQCLKSMSVCISIINSLNNQSIALYPSSRIGLLVLRGVLAWLGLSPMVESQEPPLSPPPPPSPPDVEAFKLLITSQPKKKK